MPPRRSHHAQRAESPVINLVDSSSDSDVVQLTPDLDAPAGRRITRSAAAAAATETATATVAASASPSGHRNSSNGASTAMPEAAAAAATPAAATPAAATAAAAAAPQPGGGSRAVGSGGGGAGANDEVEGASCTICIEPLTDGGSRRPAALRCGHIFCFGCISEWLRQAGKCPQCKRRAKNKDITCLYNLPVTVAPAPPPDPGPAMAALRAQLETERQQRERERQERERLAAQLQQMQHQQWLQQQAVLLAARAGCGPPQAPALLPAQQSYMRHHQDHQQQQQQQQQWGPRDLAPPPGDARLAGAKRHADSLGSQAMAQTGPSRGRPSYTWHNTGPPAGGSSAASSGPEPPPAPATAAAAAAGEGPRLRLSPSPGGAFLGGGTPRVAPGVLEVVQEYGCFGSRAFSLDSSMLLLAESVPGAGGAARWRGPAGGGGGSGAAPQRLRKVSIFVPTAPIYIPLPGAASVRAVCPCPKRSGRVAVGTQGAGLLVVSTQSDNVVHRIAMPGGGGGGTAPGVVWSAAWSRSNDQQLLVGLDRGRIGLVDLRMTWEAHKGLVMLSSADVPAAAAQLLLRVLPVPEGLCSAADGNACVVAMPGGVYAWSERGGGSFSRLLDSRLHGGSCEGLALAEAEGGGAPVLCASFRTRPQAGAPQPGAAQQQRAAHLLYRLERVDEDAGPQAAPVAAAASSGGGGGGGGAGGGAASADLRATAQLTGHNSCAVVTSGTFARLRAADAAGGSGLAFLSGDESSRTVAVWDCCGGGESGVLCASPSPLPEPAVQVSVVQQETGVIVGALCDSKLQLCEWRPC